MLGAASSALRDYMGVARSCMARSETGGGDIAMHGGEAAIAAAAAIAALRVRWFRHRRLQLMHSLASVPELSRASRDSHPVLQRRRGRTDHRR